MQWLECSITSFHEAVPVARFLTIKAPSFDDVIGIAGNLARLVQTRTIQAASQQLSGQGLPRPRESRSAESHEVFGKGVFTAYPSSVATTFEIHGRLPHVDGTSQWWVGATCARQSFTALAEHSVWARDVNPGKALHMVTKEVSAGVDMSDAIACMRAGHRVALVDVGGLPATLLLRSVTPPFVAPSSK